MKSRQNKKFFKSVLKLFLIYLIAVPAVYFILDSESFKEHLKEDPAIFILIIAGIALGISLVLTFWLRRDPEMNEW